MKPIIYLANVKEDELTIENEICIVEFIENISICSNNYVSNFS